jgi:hypothetical protein
LTAHFILEPREVFLKIGRLVEELVQGIAEQVPGLVSSNLLPQCRAHALDRHKPALVCIFALDRSPESAQMPELGFPFDAANQDP